MAEGGNAAVYREVHFYAGVLSVTASTDSGVFPDPDTRAGALCTELEVTSLLITGDHPATARAIATELGIIGGGDRVVDCREIGDASDLGEARVFARATPEQKLTIIQVRQA